MSKIKTEEMIEPVVKMPEIEDEVFDFTRGPEVLDSRHYDAYYRLRRYAMLRNDPSLLPDGKLMTLSEIEGMIGREFNENLRGKCC